MRVWIVGQGKMTDRQTDRDPEKGDAEGRKLGLHTQANKWLRTEA